MKPVLIGDEAERELIGAVDFYERRRAGSGLEFERITHETVRAIQRDFQRHPLQEDGTRRVVMRRFPFIIHYPDLPDYIWVVAFAHTSRKPGYWKERLKTD